MDLKFKEHTIDISAGLETIKPSKFTIIVNEVDIVLEATKRSARRPPYI